MKTVKHKLCQQCKQCIARCSQSKFGGGQLPCILLFWKWLYFWIQIIHSIWSGPVINLPDCAIMFFAALKCQIYLGWFDMNAHWPYTLIGNIFGQKGVLPTFNLCKVSSWAFSKYGFQPQPLKSIEVGSKRGGNKKSGGKRDVIVYWCCFGVLLCAEGQWSAAILLVGQDILLKLYLALDMKLKFYFV